MYCACGKKRQRESEIYPQMSSDKSFRFSSYRGGCVGVMQVQRFIKSYWEPGTTCVTKGAFTLFSTTSACFTCIPMGSGRKVDRMGDFIKTMLSAFLRSFWSAIKSFKRSLLSLCFLSPDQSGDSSGNKQDKNR